jgi:type IV secretory pathway TraG/TraD family ATPase VirD4
MDDIVKKQDIEQPQIATARWGDPSYIAKQYPYSPGSIWLGRNPHNEDEAIGYKNDSHVFVCAGTRKGKGRAFLVNNLTKWPGSIVCVDPKGENATITAIRRGSGNKKYCDGIKQDTYVLDPFRCAKVPEKLRGYYNPLDAIDPEDEELLEKANNIADAICIIPESTSGDSADWAERGKKFIARIIAHLMTYKAYKKEDRNLITVCRLVMEGEVQGAKDIKREMKIEITPFETLLEDMLENTACDGWIKSMARDIQLQRKEIPKYYESIRSSAGTQLEFLMSPGIERTIRNTGYYKRTFDISKLRKSKKGISIYLCLPLKGNKTYNRWQRTMITVILDEMQKAQGLPATGHQMLVSIDEFQNLGKMEQVEEAMNKVAGSGVKMMIVAQNLGGIQELYKKKWDAFLTELQIFFGADDPTTQKHLEDSLGQTEIVKKTKTINASKTKTDTEGETTGTTHTENTSETKTQTKNRSKSMNRSKTENWNLGKSWSNAQSSSRADTWNQGNSSSTSRSTNQADTWNEGNSSSASRSINQADTWNQGNSSSKSQAYNETENWNKGVNWSDSKNYGESEGKQAGKNYGPHIFFRGWEHTDSESNNSSRSTGNATSEGGNSSTGGAISKGTTDTIGANSSIGGTASRGTSDTTSTNSSIGGTASRGTSDTTGTNSSIGGTTSRGTTDTIGGSSSEGGGTSKGETDTIGEGESIGLQTGSSDATQQSTQIGHSNAYQIGGSVAESFHKKPLLAVNEVNEFLASPQEKDHVAYPGMALIRISGELPFFLRKSNYDQDPEFARCFNPNPAYKYTPVEEQTLLGYQYTKRNYLDITIPKIMVDYGYYLTPVIRVKEGQNVKMNEELFSYQKPLSKWEKIETPFDGKVIKIAAKDQYKENGYIMTVRYDVSMSEEDKELLHDYFWENKVRLIIEEFNKLFRIRTLISVFLKTCKDKIKSKKLALMIQLKWKLEKIQKRYKEYKENLHKLKLIEQKLEEEKAVRDKVLKAEKEAKAEKEREIQKEREEREEHNEKIKEKITNYNQEISTNSKHFEDQKKSIKGIWGETIPACIGLAITVPVHIFSSFAAPFSALGWWGSIIGFMLTWALFIAIVKAACFPIKNLITKRHEEQCDEKIERLRSCILEEEEKKLLE